MRPLAWLAHTHNEGVLPGPGRLDLLVGEAGQMLGGGGPGLGPAVVERTLLWTVLYGEERRSTVSCCSR